METKEELLPNKCSYVFKSDSSKVCNKPCMNSMCQYHTKISYNFKMIEETEMILMAIAVKGDLDLHLYTMPKLRAFAKFNKIKGFSKLKKQDLLTLIQQSLS